MTARRARGAGRIAASAVLLLLAGCDARPHRSPFDWERMRDQPRSDPYARSEFFADGLAMREPPPGAVPADADEPRARTAGANATVVPLQVDRALLDEGRGRFETFCAPCHDFDGSAQSPVARNMQLRHPPSLLDDRIRTLPVGRIYQAIAEGYGLMPSYAHQLSSRERWAIVAYVRALQLSRRATLSELPAEVRAEAQRTLMPETPR